MFQNLHLRQPPFCITASALIAFCLDGEEVVIGAVSGDQFGVSSDFGDFSVFKDDDLRGGGRA